MKNLSQNEAVGVFAGVVVVALVFVATRYNPLAIMSSHTEGKSPTEDVVTLEDTKRQPAAAAQALSGAMDAHGNVTKLVIEDIRVGTGGEAKAGDMVSVHYKGTLQNGTVFDNSYDRGEPITFTLGEGRVIQGWEKGILGMKVGGERILVIPAELAYGNRAVGPIPANSTLIFSVALVDAK